MRIAIALVLVALGMTLRFAVAGLEGSGVALMIVGGLMLIIEGTVIATRPARPQPAGWPGTRTRVEPADSGL